MHKLLTLLRELFRKPGPWEIIAAELEDAHTEKLRAEISVEYAQSIVDHTSTRIERLNARLEEYK